MIASLLAKVKIGLIYCTLKVLFEPYIISNIVKGSLSPSKNENRLDKDFYSTLHKFVLIRFIQRDQGHRGSVMHEFSSNENKVNKAVAKVRTIGDILRSSKIFKFCIIVKVSSDGVQFSILFILHMHTQMIW